jgi:pyrimidine-nucleoside phosphorylase/thymidine phosphorylase
MRAVDIICKKRDGEHLTDREIAWMVSGLATGEVTDYQWSALLMAIVFRGMSEGETTALTFAMMESGSIVDFSSLPGPKIDKHSTGGVGDKTSLILAPLAAAAGVLVPMVSGRGLGHTGGTLDKLEAIPGFCVELDLQRYREVLEECGLVLIGQTAELAPADRYLYALRDATATVESIPLVASSIMSKKLAEGIDGLVLDVKTGNGAFLPELDDARSLARTMCAIGRLLGKRMRAMITRMDQPLGNAVGNAVEVAESIACLRGEGPADLVELSIELAAEMLVMGDRARSREDAREICSRLIASGAALERFRRVIAAQGGDPRVVDDLDRLPQARYQQPVAAPRSGLVAQLLSRPIGHACMLLGAGRLRMDSAVDPAVGVIVHKKLGDLVETGEPLCTMLFNDPANRDEAAELIRNCYTIGDGPVERVPTIVEEF